MPLNTDQASAGRRMIRGFRVDVMLVKHDHPDHTCTAQSTHTHSTQHYHAHTAAHCHTHTHLCPSHKKIPPDSFIGSSVFSMRILAHILNSSSHRSVMCQRAETGSSMQMSLLEDSWTFCSPLTSFSWGPCRWMTINDYLYSCKHNSE